MAAVASEGLDDQELGAREPCLRREEGSSKAPARTRRSSRVKPSARLALSVSSVLGAIAGGACWASWIHGRAATTTSDPAAGSEAVVLAGFGSQLPASFPSESLHPLGYDSSKPGAAAQASSLPPLQVIDGLAGVAPGASTLDAASRGAQQVREASLAAASRGIDAAGRMRDASLDAAQSSVEAARHGLTLVSPVASSVRNASVTAASTGLGTMRDGFAVVSAGVAQKVSEAQQALGHAQLPSLPSLPGLPALRLPGSQPSAEPECGTKMPGVNFPGNDIAAISQMPTAGHCCQACTRNPNCVAWTWGATPGQSFTHKCWLKGSSPRSWVPRLSDPDFVSGTLAHVGRTIEVRQAATGESLFCFSLVIPWSYEPSMIAMQYQLRSSLFDCDEYALFSNQALNIAPGVNTIPVQVDLQAKTGGEFGTALNTQIFIAVWDEVIAGGRYNHHDWTVKVDPDSVFLPGRLRIVVKSHAEQPNGVLINNCEKGLHGPIEVLSRSAVQQWALGKNMCVNHFTALCNGPCKWGEDMFIDQCFDKVLHVARQLDKRILIEDHCDPPPNWRACNQPNIVALHPFKTNQEWTSCFQSTMAAR